MIAIIVIGVLACSIIIFVILSLFSPRVQGKMMSKQIKSVKHMMDYSKDDLKELMKTTAKTGTIAKKEKHEKNERIWSPASRKAESQVRLRRRRKAVQKYIQQSSEEKGYHW